MSQAIQWAKAETGEVAAILAASTFRPGAPAFTTLIKTCGRAGQWEKALELYAAMKARGVAAGVDGETGGKHGGRQRHTIALQTAAFFFNTRSSFIPSPPSPSLTTTTANYASQSSLSTSDGTKPFWPLADLKRVSDKFDVFWSQPCKYNLEVFWNDLQLRYYGRRH